MDGWKRMLWTVGLVAAWYLIVTLAANSWDVLGMSGNDWYQVLRAILAGLGALATNWILPFIKQYGIGSDTEA